MGSDDKQTDGQGAKISTQELFGDFLGEVESAWDAGLVREEEKGLDRGASAPPTPVENPSSRESIFAESVESSESQASAQIAPQEGGIALDGSKETASTEFLGVPLESENGDNGLRTSPQSGSVAGKDVVDPASSSIEPEAVEAISTVLEEPTQETVSREAVSQEAVRQEVASVPVWPTDVSPSVGPDLANPALARFAAELQREEGNTEALSIEQAAIPVADADQVESTVALSSAMFQDGSSKLDEPSVTQPLASEVEPFGLEVEAVESSAYMPWMEEGAGTNWTRPAAMALFVGVVGLVIWWFGFRQTSDVTQSTGGASSVVSEDTGIPADQAADNPEQTVSADQQTGELPTTEAVTVSVARATEIDSSAAETSDAVATQERISAWLDSEMAVREQRLRAVFDEQRQQLEEEIARIELATTAAVGEADAQADRSVDSQAAGSTESAVPGLTAQESAAEELSNAGEVTPSSDPVAAGEES